MKTVEKNFKIQFVTFWSFLFENRDFLRRHRKVDKREMERAFESIKCVIAVVFFCEPCKQQTFRY